LILVYVILYLISVHLIHFVFHYVLLQLHVLKKFQNVLMQLHYVLILDFVCVPFHYFQNVPVLFIYIHALIHFVFICVHSFILHFDCAHVLHYVLEFHALIPHCFYVLTPYSYVLIPYYFCVRDCVLLEFIYVHVLLQFRIFEKQKMIFLMIMKRDCYVLEKISMNLNHFVV